MLRTDLLIVGAGPYGLATAAAARQLGVDCHVLGQPMDFWWRHMPDGMLLRSGLDWHLDPLGVRTLRAYLRHARIDPAHADPMPIGLFRDYGRWFQEVHGLQPDARLVRTLSQASDGSSFTAELSDGERVQASHVLVALGFGSFPYVPPELARLVPAHRMTHTLDLVDFDALAGQDVLIVGGRQSAYEWAALLAEHGARTVHLAHRHAAPRFAPADWTWVEPMLQASATSPGWFRRQTLAEQEATRLRFWAEGRLKLEPWLAPRIARRAVHVWEGASVAAADEQDDGRLRVTLSTDTQINVDRVVLATGYRVDVQRLSLLDGDASGDRQALPAESGGADRSLLARLRSTSGFPSLDEDFQSSVRGLFFSGLPATNDFGPFFGFVAGCRAAPLRILARILRDDPGRRDHPALRHIGQSAA